jgi:excisionase family DNA binding protein
MTDMLTTVEAGQIAGVDDGTIGFWIRNYGLPAERVGRAWTIRRCDLDEFLEHHAERVAARLREGRHTWSEMRIFPSDPPRPAAPLPSHSAPVNATRQAVCSKCGRRCVLIGKVCYDCLIGRTR